MSLKMHFARGLDQTMKTWGPGNKDNKGKNPFKLFPSACSTLSMGRSKFEKNSSNYDFSYRLFVICCVLYIDVN